MYSNINGTAYINGKNGIYDGIIKDNSVRYGRNSVANQTDYLQHYTVPDVEFPDISNVSKLSNDEFDKKMDEYDKAIKQLSENEKQRAPIHFVQRYMPESSTGVDTKALMGAAYEEMGKRTSISVEELDDGLNSAFQDLTEQSGIKLSVKASDLNNDGKLDLAEYAASILVSDALSTDNKNFKLSNVNGEITDKGQDSTLAYANPINYNIANKTYQALYETYNLAQAQKDFVKNPNNMV